jgi:sigma-B regulation protein RsbU (phosphoserine phosphatase)
VELISLIAGISMTKTITGAVHNLYEGTRKVTAGDFSHRIAVRGTDQLAALSSSFNSMTENLERLFAIEKEKERLQSELLIATEVQAQLFPKDMPMLTTLHLTGVCKPARMVSGDYYDFFCLQDKKVALAIGDVAGKGISAALLMAAIQSIMRAQLNHVDTGGCIDTSRVVSLLNRQLYASTSPEKYATFFFGIYDEHSRVLSYTNAGHLPPILISGGEATLLEVTGTVVGAFPMVMYEEKRLTLKPDDLLVAYTDGIEEPENEYGEQYGEERLKEILIRNHHLETRDLIVKVMDSVVLWTSAEEMPDDMTVLVARVH